jgi:hypothetical protein
VVWCTLRPSICIGFASNGPAFKLSVDVVQVRNVCLQLLYVVLIKRRRRVCRFLPCVMPATFRVCRALEICQKASSLVEIVHQDFKHAGKQTLGKAGSSRLSRWKRSNSITSCTRPLLSLFRRCKRLLSTHTATALRAAGNEQRTHSSVFVLKMVCCLRLLPIEKPAASWSLMQERRRLVFLLLLVGAGAVREKTVRNFVLSTTFTHASRLEARRERKRSSSTERLDWQRLRLHCY